jgi:hypothetical protein
MSTKRNRQKLLDKLIGHAIWVWFTATILFIFNQITPDQWFVISLTLMGGRVINGIRPCKPVETPTETPESNVN